MVDLLGHRGPDAKGTYEVGNCSLGHNRLRVIDLTVAGDQPMSNEDGTVWVVFNGELYNFLELRRRLEAAGHEFRSKTDTEVLVHLYEGHGDRLDEHLRGMLAFAVWDERGQQLILCRDRLGIKPLYYRADSGQLEFASEVRALRRPGDSLDMEALGSFLRLGWIPGPRTILRGIVELPPAHTLIWKAGRIRVRRYWSPPFSARNVSSMSAGEFGEVLTDGMQRHVVADVPVGVFLSSGVDSAIVTALAARVSSNIRAYTVVFDGGTDESVEAAAVARHIGVDHTAVRVGSQEVLRSVRRIVSDMDQPSVDGVNSWVIAQAVRDAGIVVALSGVGGDELFSGYSTFRHVPRIVGAGKIAQMVPSSVRTLPARAASLSQRTAHSRSRRAWEAIGVGGWAVAYGSVRGMFSVIELEALWTPAKDMDCLGPIRMPWSGDLRGESMVGQLELANYLPYQLLRDADCMSMAHALELRLPLLDDRVIESAVVGQCSLTKGWSKAHLIEAVDCGLMYLLNRPKRTFTLPFEQWMRGPLREVVFAALISLGEAGMGFDRRELTDLWHGYQSGWVGWRQVWALAVLGLWLEEHDDGKHLPLGVCSV
jgi:asparagine synthase (glutamine-hydrolysing)